MRTALVDAEPLCDGRSTRNLLGLSDDCRRAGLNRGRLGHRSGCVLWDRYGPGPVPVAVDRMPGTRRQRCSVWAFGLPPAITQLLGSGRRIVFPVDFGLAFPCRVALGVGLFSEGSVIPRSLGMRDDYAFFGRLLACGGVLVEGPRVALVPACDVMD